MREPVLDERDREAWEGWMHVARLHAHHPSFAIRVAEAKTTAHEALESSTNPVAMWSAGKDSTAMAHLLRVEMGVDVVAASIKDDLDFPGETEYVERWAEAWDLRLRIIRPEVSLEKWLKEHASGLEAGEDVHGRSAGLSREHFYPLAEAASRDHDLTFIGLRKGESDGRMRNRTSRGKIYRKKSGERVCTPIADWSGLDVMAYLVSREIEPLAVYRCIGLMHAREPWRLRKSWWFPGEATWRGAAAWLRRYYPSLADRACRILPELRRFGG